MELLECSRSPRYPNQWITLRGRNGMTVMTVRAFDQNSGALLVSLGSEFSQQGIKKLVRDICREAGLPEPWTGR